MNQYVTVTKGHIKKYSCKAIYSISWNFEVGFVFVLMQNELPSFFRALNHSRIQSPCPL